MSINSDPSKPAQEVIFSKKLKTVPHPSIAFNKNPLSLCPVQCFEIGFRFEINFKENIKDILTATGLEPRTT